MNQLFDYIFPDENSILCVAFAKETYGRTKGVLFHLFKDFLVHPVVAKTLERLGPVIGCYRSLIW